MFELILSYSLSRYWASCDQDVWAITHIKSRWPVYPSSSVLSPSHWRRSSGQIRCSSPWKGSAPSVNVSVDSGGTQTIEQLWEEYFADASQWWDNRVDKKNLRSPDFKHKVTRKALWIDGWSTPAWVTARLTTVTQGRLQYHAGYDTRDSQDTAQGKRFWHGHVTPGVKPSLFVNAMSYSWATMEKETPFLLEQESRGKLYKVAVAVCMCKVLVP